MKRYEIKSVYYDGMIGFEFVAPDEANAWTLYERCPSGEIKPIADFYFEYSNGDACVKAREIAESEVARLTAAALETEEN